MIVSRPHQWGFSLLEVLVALAILAISLGMLMQSFSLSGRNVQVTADYTRALVLAESKLTEAGTLTAVGSESAGQFDDRFRWVLRAVPVEAEYFGPSALIPYRVSVEVVWESDGKTRTLNLETLKVEARR